MTECPFCSADIEKGMLAHISECQHAPEEAREQASDFMAQVRKLRESETCCKYRKMVILRPSFLREEESGIPDSELADVMTFDQHMGKPVVMFRFCPWCGKPWVPTGALL